MPRITPFLWFDSQAEEAARFYVSVFRNSRILSTTRFGDNVMTVDFELDGQRFTALNAGPRFKFTEAISFVVDCQNQQEVDDYWNKLVKGGEEQPCGWLKDRFGLSWQIIPAALGKLLGDPDPARAKRVADAMFKMKKIEIGKLEEAARA